MSESQQKYQGVAQTDEEERSSVHLPPPPTEHSSVLDQKKFKILIVVTSYFVISMWVGIVKGADSFGQGAFRGLPRKSRLLLGTNGSSSMPADCQWRSSASIHIGPFNNNYQYFTGWREMHGTRCITGKPPKTNANSKQTGPWCFWTKCSWLRMRRFPHRCLWRGSNVWWLPPLSLD